LELEDFDKIGSDIPLLVNMMPSGKFLMEDFFYAGGIQVVLKDIVTVSGKTVKENNAKAICYNSEVISTIDKPLKPKAGIAVLKGNLCENGAVIKPSAATPALMKQWKITMPALTTRILTSMNRLLSS
jgi:dihydroxy-acid dehydratase